MYQQKRSFLHPDQQVECSVFLADQALSDPTIRVLLGGAAPILHTYLPIVKQNEVDTWPLIRQIWCNFPQVRTWSSVTEAATQTMTHFHLTADTLLAESVWGIPAPAQAYLPVVGQPDMVLVPLLACDLAGHRVGYGGGYYDRFLATVTPSCLKIGLSFFAPLAEPINAEPTDVRLDACVTPDRIYWFTK